MKKNILNFSITESENISLDDSVIIENTKMTKYKKPQFTEKELEQLFFLSKLDKFEDDINNCNNFIKKLKASAKELRQVYNQDIIKIKKMKKSRENSDITGFNKKIVLPNKLANLIKVPNGSIMTMPEYTKKVFSELKERNLYYKDDNRIFRADKEFIEIFELKDSVNKSITFPDPEGFNIRTIQKCISNAYKKLTKL
jgi:hypothetical protein